MENIFFKNKKVASAGRPGFSLVEMIVAIFIFSLIMTVVTSVFVQVFNARKKSKEIQMNIEDARYAMELMAKTLRMSSVKNYGNDFIVIYDYSQGKCIRYYRDSDSKLKMIAAPEEEASACNDPNGTPQTMMNAELGNLLLDIVETDGATANTMGKVTIAMTICAGGVSSCETMETIQTTVSLRDYGNLD